MLPKRSIIAIAKLRRLLKRKEKNFIEHFTDSNVPFLNTSVHFRGVDDGTIYRLDLERLKRSLTRYDRKRAVYYKQLN